MPPVPPAVWVPADLDPDVELRIQAMGSLILSDSDEAVKVIPILRDIALEADNPGQARRALSALVLSKRPEARSTVVEVAKTAPEPVQVEAVRVLGRIRDPEISSMLLHVYADAGEPVKFQIVSSFAQRAETASLVRIAESEGNAQLRATAIITLGRAPGGFRHLRGMYGKVDAAFKRPVIVGLFNARDDEGLIGIAMRERYVPLRKEAVERLRLLGTPRAKQYLEQHDEK
jgi:HEAT repeat protein